MRQRPRNIVRLTKAWALVDTGTDKLIVLSGQAPVYWYRANAHAAAAEHGMTSYGRSADVNVRRVLITQDGPSRA